MISHLISVCLNFSWVIHSSMVSIWLFGEYPYPTEEQND